ASVGLLRDGADVLRGRPRSPARAAPPLCAGPRPRHVAGVRDRPVPRAALGYLDAPVARRPEGGAPPSPAARRPRAQLGDPVLRRRTRAPGGAAPRAGPAAARARGPREDPSAARRLRRRAPRGRPRLHGLDAAHAGRVAGAPWRIRRAPATRCGSWSSAA